MRGVFQHEGNDIVMLQPVATKQLRGAVRRSVELGIADRLSGFGNDHRGLVRCGGGMDKRVHRASSPRGFWFLYVPRSVAS
jgi:hypothetical protein